MIQHIVFLSLTANADEAELADVMSGLAGLIGKIDGFTAFTHGPNIDVEGKSPESPYGFVCTFRTLTALHSYAADSRHRALGERLVALCGGADNIKVYDINAGDIPCD